MNFSIRTASAADIPEMHALRNRVRENRLSDPDRVTEASYLPYVASGSAWVAETGTGIAGFAALDAPHDSVWALFVDPNTEGAGIGRALHLRMLQWAREQGAVQLSLSTEVGTRAQYFYKSAGWTEAGLNNSGEMIFELRLRD